MKNRRRFELLLTLMEREFIARTSWERIDKRGKHMSMAEYLRSGRIPENLREMQRSILTLRKRQKGIKGIVDGIRR